MNGQPPVPPTFPQPQQPAQTLAEQQEAANMLLVVQAIQRLHVAFDSFFLRSRDLP
jgi:hypothetical protein